MIKRVLIVIFLLVSSKHIIAQNEIDALRYSFITYGGTARYMGMSGAFSALGADFSVLSTNPAGIGMFKKSRVVFAPGVISTNSSADYLNENTKDEFISANMNSLGLILNLKSYKEDDTGWRTVAFGVGYNRLRNFSSDITIAGVNDNSSLLDLFMINSDGYHPDNLYDPEWIAFDTYGTDTIPDSDYTYINPLWDIYGEHQKKLIQTSGGIGEFVFSLGGNYENIIQIGATFGIQNIRYYEVSEFTEYTDTLDFESFNYIENLETKGTGFNFKFGMIYRPVNFFRLGLAFHTPTFYTMKDIYSYSMQTNWRSPDVDGYTEYYAETSEYEYIYEFYSPFRTVAGVAFILSKIGIISADYEYVNYGKARLRADDYDFETENNIITNSYTSGHNFRLGTEIRLAPIYLRGGISYYSSPKSLTYDANGSISAYSLGVGLKTKNVYIDIAFNHSFTTKEYLMYEYDFGMDEKANLNLAEDQINFTLGYKF
ncbi:MAG: hypothetical protein ABFS35_09560 [Bacteroidota bacterium]